MFLSLILIDNYGYYNYNQRQCEEEFSGIKLRTHF